MAKLPFTIVSGTLRTIPADRYGERLRKIMTAKTVLAEIQALGDAEPDCGTQFFTPGGWSTYKCRRCPKCTFGNRVS